MEDISDIYRKGTQFYLIQAKRTIRATGPREQLTLCVEGEYKNESIKGYITLNEMQMLQLIGVLTGKVNIILLEKPKGKFGFQPSN